MKRLVDKIRSLISATGIAISTALTLIPLPLVAIFPQLSVLFIQRPWGRSVIWSTFSRVKIIGSVPDNLRSSNVLYISNHQSLLDIPIIMGWVDRSVAFLARRSLLKTPVVGVYMRVMGCEFLDRAVSREELKTLERVAEKSQNGKRFVLFPEGTRSRNGKLKSFKKASRRLLRSDNLTVIPIFIDGSHRILAPETLKFTPSLVTIHLGQPIETSSSTPDDIFSEIHSWMESIEKKCIQPNGVLSNIIDSEKYPPLQPLIKDVENGLRKNKCQN